MGTLTYHDLSTIHKVVLPNILQYDKIKHIDGIERLFLIARSTLYHIDGKIIDHEFREIQNPNFENTIIYWSKDRWNLVNQKNKMISKNMLSLPYDANLVKVLLPHLQDFHVDGIPFGISHPRYEEIKLYLENYSISKYLD